MRGDLLDRAVEHMVQHRPALLHVLRENLVDQLPIDPLVLDRHLAGHITPTIGSRLQRPVQPVWWRMMSSRPEAAMCLRNSSSTSSLPAACSQVAEPTWMRIRSLGRPPAERFLGPLDQRLELLGNLVVTVTPMFDCFSLDTLQQATLPVVKAHALYCNADFVEQFVTVREAWRVEKTAYSD